MALQISENKGTFNLIGKINETTSRSLIIHFEYLLSIKRSVKLNIDGVNEIDVNGVAALKTLYGHALIYNKDFSIIGNGSKDIYDEIRFYNVA